MRHLIQALGYDTSGNFIPAAEAAAFEALPFSHLCRKWHDGKSSMGFAGVYVLREDKEKAAVPVVVVFQPSSDEDAKNIHKLVWNQDFVPFVLVESPTCVRLYSGFDYQSPRGDGETGLIAPLRDFNRITEDLAGLRAADIDDGTLWSKWGKHVDPAKRVDWRLLKSLGDLAVKLRLQGLRKEVSHAFIGRYVYLRYLLDRGFLSPRKLSRWGLETDQIFSYKATLKAFRELNARLDDETDGLNGSIFPFPVSAINKDHLQTVACAFAGEDVPNGQQVFDFLTYDFSYIPIETLSVIYEQFLHEPEEAKSDKGRGKTKSKGREAGAYYTPIPLVNFMIAEMDARRRLQSDMKVLDPSCGSGAFLVQTYRMLIERAIRESGRKNLPPSELRKILTTQIYGVDRDEDACRIAEMSLLVTLLDYVDPPDLEGKYKGFLLPTLKGNNIFEADFFDPEGDWATVIQLQPSAFKFDWVIGNPPWKKITNPPADPRDLLALQWITRKGAHPTGGNQIAEAFVWECQSALKAKGVASMVLPAMTLFKSESTQFRKLLFSTVDVWSVVNFSNLAYTLFSGRTIVPAMALFFQKPANGLVTGDSVRTFAPMVINQEANRPQKAGKQLDTWSLVTNGSEVREIPHMEAIRGEAITWKLAMWGSFQDERLLRRIAKKWPSFLELELNNQLVVAQSSALREVEAGASPNPNLEFHPEIEGGLEILVKNIGKNQSWMLDFPSRALNKIPIAKCWVRKRSGLRGLAASYPPHLILDASRRFSVFSSDFILVPPKKIGISAPSRFDLEPLLRAISVFLLSDFAKYFEFFHAPEWGIQETLSTLAVLRELPVPFANSSDRATRELAELHERILAGSGIDGVVYDKYKREVNTVVFRMLGLTSDEQCLIEDFVRTNLLMIQGKVEKETFRAPDESEILDYLTMIRDQLDEYMTDDSGPSSHHITALFDAKSIMVEIVLREGKAAVPQIRHSSVKEAEEFEKARQSLLTEHKQWIYFERNLQIYRRGRLYLFKPLQRVQWTRRQAIIDAGELIAEALGTSSD